MLFELLLVGNVIMWIKLPEMTEPQCESFARVIMQDITVAMDAEFPYGVVADDTGTIYRISNYDYRCSKL